MRWQACLHIPESGSRYLGTFLEEEEAARAYDDAALAALGERATLNFPQTPETPCAGEGAAPAGRTEVWFECDLWATKTHAFRRVFMRHLGAWHTIRLFSAGEGTEEEREMIAAWMAS